MREGRETGSNRCHCNGRNDVGAFGMFVWHEAGRRGPISSEGFDDYVVDRADTVVALP